MLLTNSLPCLPPSEPPTPAASDLEPAGQELVLHLQVVALVDLGLEGLVEDHVPGVVLDVLPARVAVPGRAPLRTNPATGQGPDTDGCPQGQGHGLEALRGYLPLHPHNPSGGQDETCSSSTLTTSLGNRVFAEVLKKESH